MNWWRQLRERGRLEEHLDRELQFHLDQHRNDLIARGHTPEDARRMARIALGGPEQIKEYCRDARGFSWLDDFLSDLKYAGRVFTQSPSFTLTAVAAIAIGIGANTAIFSVVNAVLLKPLPFPESGRIVQIEETFNGVGSATTGPRSFNLWRQQTTSFADISAHWLDHLNLTSGSRPELVPVARVTVSFFHLYGAPILHGRTFTPDEDRPGGDSVAVLGYDLWTRQFAADPGIIGRTILIGDVSYVVVGVLGPFDAQQFDQTPDIWLPFQIDPNINAKDGRLCLVTARLKPGVSITAANAELRLVAETYRRTTLGIPGPKDSFRALLLRDALVGDVRLPLLVLAGATAFVLLIACTNVASLLLVRATGRTRELAVRAAIGAGRGRIVRQLLAESAAPTLTGGVLGLALGVAGIRALMRLYSGSALGPATIAIPRVGDAGASVSLDWRVLAFTALMTTAAGLICGLLPALRVVRADLTAPLKESSGRSGSGFGQTRTLSLLVAGEIALAAILLTGSALLIRTSVALRSVDTGFDSHNVLTMQMSLANTRLAQASGVGQLVQESVHQIEAVPGVESVAASCCLPLETVWQLPYIVEGRPLDGRFHGFAGWTFVSPKYFEVLKIPLLLGRTFTEQDSAGSPGVVIINETMARLAWPNSDPLNDRLLIGRTMDKAYDQDPIRQIVGIVADVRDVGLNRKPRPAMYVPIAQVPGSVTALTLPLLPMAWAVRTHGSPQALREAISSQLRLASGGLPVARIRSLEKVRTQSTARTEFNTTLMAIFGGAALLLAAIGIYGLMAYSVQQRMQEIGIRLALGAQPAQVIGAVMYRGVGLSIIGVAIGTAAALVLARLIASMLYGVTAHDPLVFTAVPLILCGTAAVAVWLPARRAGRLDPIQVLKCQ